MTFTYPTRAETVKRAPAAQPVPELAVTSPTARLERGIFPTVAAVCYKLSDPHSLANMTQDDLLRLIRLGELAREMLQEKTKESEL